MINFFSFCNPSQESTTVLPQIFHSALTKWHSTKLIVLKLRAIYRRTFSYYFFSFNLEKTEGKNIRNGSVCDKLHSYFTCSPFVSDVVGGTFLNRIHNTSFWKFWLHPCHSYWCRPQLCFLVKQFLSYLSFFIPNFLNLLLLIISFQFQSLVNAYTYFSV